ncbi:hypothetical protein AQUCO_00400677v1 [Aquilegia coerulea]|uniref:Arabinogalactan protein n=1 Tax=Aquilegia coerulea TaxID=218851 RepID=A0A2G5EW71_AQUCA|nr:hypothetical protein AQUCO_00400677v1 [Aquilegia coerulea]
MDLLKMRLLVALFVVFMAVSTVQIASAAEAPAPGPSSDGASFVPAIFASFAALAFGFGIIAPH